jgi:hypothetical protein
MEFDEEVKKTRATLERVPSDKADFMRPKSMPLGRLALTSRNSGFGLTVLTEPAGLFPAQLHAVAVPVGGAARSRVR